MHFWNEAHPVLFGTDIWKGFGHNAVLYLTALLAIDQTLYEAVPVDGSGRFSRLWHITLPGRKATIALLAVYHLAMP